MNSWINICYLYHDANCSSFGGKTSSSGRGERGQEVFLSSEALPPPVTALLVAARRRPDVTALGMLWAQSSPWSLLQFHQPDLSLFDSLKGYTRRSNSTRVHTPLGNRLGSQERVKVSTSIQNTTGNMGAYRPLLLKVCKSGKRIHLGSLQILH